MPFVDLDLAARIERAEARLITDAAAAAARRLGGAQVVVTPLAGGVAAYTEPQSPLNKAAGVGFGSALDVRELEALEQGYAARSCPLQIELSTLADPSIAPMLTRRGYVLVGFENVLGLALDDARLPAAGSDIRVTSANVDFEAWLDVVVRGFASPDLQGVPSHEAMPQDVIERVVRDFASAPTVRRYLASRNGSAAGGASLRIDDRIAQLCGAATLPEQRRRGVQTALLATRLADARAAGCDLAVCMTQPGSKSQQNAQRQGFALLYSRAVLVREPGPVPAGAARG